VDNVRRQPNTDAGGNNHGTPHQAWMYEG